MPNVSLLGQKLWPAKGGKFFVDPLTDRATRLLLAAYKDIKRKRNLIKIQHWVWLLKLLEWRGVLKLWGPTSKTQSHFWCWETARRALWLRLSGMRDVAGSQTRLRCKKYFSVKTVNELKQSWLWHLFRQPHVKHPDVKLFASTSKLLRWSCSV